MASNGVFFFNYCCNLLFLRKRIGMKLRVKLVALGLCLVAVAPSIWSQKTQKEEKIMELLNLSGSGNIGKQYFVSIMDQFQNIFPDVPKEFWSEAKSLMDPNDLIEIIIPIYNRHFSQEDIEGLIAFYKTPLGQKLVKEQPIIMQESMRAGEIWGEEFAQRIMDKMKESGY